MSEKEAIEKISHPSGDNERDHSEADRTLLEFIRSLGYNDLADAFDKASEEFWYA